jgi:lipoprotein LprG
MMVERGRSDRAAGPLAALAIAALVLSSCSGGGDLPAGPDLLRRAARQMEGVESVEFDLEVEGRTGALSIRRAGGLVAATGEGQGAVSLDSGGRLVEYQVVIAQGSYFIRGPTGGWIELSREQGAALYDPARLLDPDRGFVVMLEGAEEAETERAEAVDGHDAFLIAAEVDSSLVADLVPLEAGQERLPAELWVGADPPYLRRVRVMVEVAGEPEPTTLDLTMHAFDVPADVVPPEG